MSKITYIYIYKQTDIYIPYNVLYILYNIYILNVLHNLKARKWLADETSHWKLEHAETFSHTDSSKNSELFNSIPFCRVLKRLLLSDTFTFSLYYTMLFLVYFICLLFQFHFSPLYLTTASGLKYLHLSTHCLPEYCSLPRTLLLIILMFRFSCVIRMLKNFPISL